MRQVTLEMVEICKIRHTIRWPALFCRIKRLLSVYQYPSNV